MDIQHGIYSFFFSDGDNACSEILTNPEDGYRWFFERSDLARQGHLDRNFAGASLEQRRSGEFDSSHLASVWFFRRTATTIVKPSFGSGYPLLRRVVTYPVENGRIENDAADYHRQDC